MVAKQVYSTVTELNVIFHRKILRFFPDFPSYQPDFTAFSRNFVR